MGPWKQRTLTDGYKRLEMLKLAFPNNPKITISDFEIKNSSISYTYKLIDHFKEKYPEYQLNFVIGEDQALNFTKWNKWKRIIENANIIVAKRFIKNKFPEKLSLIKDKINFIELDSKIINVSSTFIRKGHFKNNVPLAVNSYIGKEGLYIGDILQNHLSNYRYFHCLNVGKWAGKIAEKFNLDPKKAYIAGCLHDITKEWPFKEQYAYLKNFGLEGEKINIPVLHSFTGAFWVNEEYGINDRDIISSIIKHTTAHENMSDFDKAIFVADKVCDDRDYPNVEEYRKLALEDLELAFKKILIYQYRRTKKKVGRKKMNRRTIMAVATHAFSEIFKTEENK